MALKSPVEKSHTNKKSQEIKLYHFETLFSRTFFWFHGFYTKMFSEKRPILVEKTCGQRMFTTKQKRQLI